MKAKKSLGQNFLNNDKILSEIVDNGQISNNDVILEIGPGTGNLTEKIISKNPKQIILVEKDKNLVEVLREKFGKRVTLINKDILDCYKEFRFKDKIKVFGNLPYNVSTEILASFVKLDNLKEIYEKFIFVFQKEVADRILAKENTKQYGRLSVLTSWKMSRIFLFDINPIFFSPKPKVWSSLILLSPKPEYEILKNAKNLEHITNIFFNQRRKMIKKPMRQLFNNYDEIANKLDIDLNLKPQNISTENYLKICKIYENLTC